MSMMAPVLVALMIVIGCVPQASPSPAPAVTPTPVSEPSATPGTTPVGADVGDCDGIARPTCDAAWSTAAGFGLDPKLTGRAIRWLVRPTTVRGCGESIVPKIDGRFVLDAGPDVTVTVGELPGGRLAACNY